MRSSATDRLSKAETFSSKLKRNEALGYNPKEAKAQQKPIKLKKK
jgi:hypothetical protein